MHVPSLIYAKSKGTRQGHEIMWFVRMIYSVYSANNKQIFVTTKGGYGHMIHIREVRSKYTAMCACGGGIMHCNILASGTDLRLCGMYKFYSSIHTIEALPSVV